MKNELFFVLALTSATASFAQITEAPSTVGATYVEASSTVTLPVGAKVSRLYARNTTDPYVVQRLTQRTYWFQKQFYSTTFYVGDKGVLLFDPLDSRSADILKAIAEVTPLPIRAIVYSHNHADHIGDATTLLAALNASGIKPRIIATKATSDKMERLGSQLPRATELVSWPKGQFKFEDLKVSVLGFAHAAHADDHSAWLLTSEKVLHLPDMINPDQPPFWRFGGSDHFSEYEANLAQVEALDWQYLNGGHGNVGSREDLQFYKVFVADLKAAVAQAVQTTTFGEGVDTTALNAHTALLPAWLNAVSSKTVETLRPRYGQLYGFEAATRSNAEMVALHFFSYR